MAKRRLRRWRWGLLIASFALLWGFTMGAPGAQAQSDSRLTQLEFDVRQLQTQLNRLEAQLSQSGPVAAPSRPAVPSGSVSGDPSLAVQFDNLATLAIELKQQVRQLESRVTQLEQASR